MSTIISIAGPSLAGKTVLKSKLVEQDFIELVTCTTRPMRHGEKNNIDYYFLSKEQFEKDIQNGELIEYTEHVGNYYGLSKKEIINALNSNKPLVVVLEPNGMQALKKFCLEENITNISLFISNPEDILATRFLERFKNDKMADPQKYAQRMIAMFTKEKFIWGQEKEKTSLYNLIYNEFNYLNEQEILESINKEIKQSQKKQSRHKITPS